MTYQERQKEIYKKWRKEHPDKWKEIMQKWRDKNPDYNRNYLKKYRSDPGLCFCRQFLSSVKYYTGKQRPIPDVFINNSLLRRRNKSPEWFSDLLNQLEDKLFVRLFEPLCQQIIDENKMNQNLVAEFNRLRMINTKPELYNFGVSSARNLDLPELVG